ncbi:hypothetical protein [Jeotgalicoccus sp. ATCC 8456]|uniref:hypothetical protein n=1 Tax=Jeotgalicoccus sp. ATCC 8456 TaxID=946435 RepID=UPI0018E60664|nr:hypothetical protein [Jeotgalicoccus sp. ATCC 8456]QQD85665.1 hypothetical protein JEM45_03305 [Jeotgalicoccus sp. ATCC 8456]
MKKRILLISFLFIVIITLFFVYKSDNNIYVNIDGSEIKVKHSLTKEQNIIVVYNQNRDNETFDMSQFIVQDKDSDKNDFKGEVVMKTATDFVSPYGLLAENNTVNNKGFTVGGSHSTTGANDYPTSRFGGFDSIKLDDQNLDKDGFYEGRELTLNLSHYIYASNTIDGFNTRDSLLEERTYKITDGEHNVDVSLTALEDVILTRYAGLQMIQPDYYDHFAFSSQPEAYTVQGEEEGRYTLKSKSYEDIHSAILYNDSSMLIMSIDRDFGIGDGSLAPKSTDEFPQSPMTFTGGEFGKIYAHNLGRNNNKVTLEKDESLAYSGSYKFKANNLINRKNYID